MKPPARRLALAGAGAALLGAWVARAATPAREIEIVARRFRYAPDRIALASGERVVLLLRTLDFAHGFSVPALGLRADFVPDRVVRVELQAGRPGMIDFLCDNFCGTGHEQMQGRFIVSDE